MGDFDRLGNFVLYSVGSLNEMIPGEILIWFLMINDGIIFLKFEIFYDFSFVMLIPVWGCDSVERFVFDFLVTNDDGFLRLIL